MHMGIEREVKLSGVYSYKDTNSFGSRTNSHELIYHNYFLTPNTVTQGIRISIYEFWGDANIQSTQGTKSIHRSHQKPIALFSLSLDAIVKVYSIRPRAIEAVANLVKTSADVFLGSSLRLIISYADSSTDRTHPEFLS